MTTIQKPTTATTPAAPAARPAAAAQAGPAVARDAYVGKAAAVAAAKPVARPGFFTRLYQPLNDWLAKPNVKGPAVVGCVVGMFVSGWSLWAGVNPLPLPLAIALHVGMFLAIVPIVAASKD